MVAGFQDPLRVNPAFKTPTNAKANGMLFSRAQTGEESLMHEPLLDLSIGGFGRGRESLAPLIVPSSLQDWSLLNSLLPPSGVQNRLLNLDENIYIPITRAEFTVLNSIFNFIIPYLLGWHAFTATMKPEDSVRSSNNATRSSAESEWVR